MTRITMMSYKTNCVRDNEGVIDSLPNGSYLKVDDKGNIVRLLDINKKDFINREGSYESFEDDFFNDDEEDSAVEGLKSKYSIPSNGFACGAEINTKPQVIVDVDYVADLLQGLEPQELKYISKLCEVLIAEGEF